MKTISRFPIYHPAITLAITLVVSQLPHASAADGIWTGGDGFNEWSATTNWSGGVVADGTDSTAVFSSSNSVFSPVVLDSARTVGNLTFGPPDGDTWDLNDNSDPANVLTLAVSAGSPVIAVNGYDTTATIGAGIAGTSGFTKTGQGVLVLAGINSYTGATIVEEGSLFLDQNGALGSGNNLTVEADTPFVEGGFLSLGNTTQTVGAVTINGTGDKVSDGNLVATSYLLNNDSFDAGGCGCSGSFISAGLGGIGANLTKSGVGTTYLSGTNTYTGTTTVNGGTLIFDKTASLYNGVEADWIPANISVASGATLGVAIGDTGEFSIAQAKTLLTNLTTAINNNGLQAGSAFAIDTTFSATDVTFDHVIADSTGTGGGALGFTKEGEGTLILNQANTYTGPTTVRGGTLQFAQTESLYNGDTAKWTAADITVAPGATLAVSVGGTGEFSVAQAKTLLNNLTTSINDNGLQAFSTFAIDTTNATGTTTFDQVIADSTGTSGAGSLGFAKLGDNTLVLDQDSTYTGVTFVEGGTLIVNGNISTSLGTLVSGGTLGGSGTMGPVAVDVDGTIAPGNSPGILNTGDFFLGGTLAAEINGTTVGTEYDQLNVTGFVKLYGILSLTVTGFSPTLGDLFFLINNDDVDGIDGTFSGLAQDSEFFTAGQQWRISYTADFDSDAFVGGNDLALMAVPEPSAALMGVLGLAALLRRRRPAYPHP